jgi:ankyrin repeat protein
MPVEIMLRIISYLHVLDFFPFKQVNRYIYNIISDIPLLTFSNYVAELVAEDRRRRGSTGGLGKPAIGIAASRGQEGLLIRLQEIAAERDFNQIKKGRLHSRKRYMRKYSMPADPFLQRTPLHWAAENGQTALVGRLIRNKEILWSTDRDGNTAIHLAAENGHTETVKLLLEKTSKYHHSLKSMALHPAVENGWKEIVQLLLDEGVDPDLRDALNRPALHVAAMNGLDEITCLLLDHGASLEAKDRFNHTALICAAVAGRETTVKLLLARAAKTEGKNVLLHFAASVGDVKMVRLALDQGAEVGAKDALGKTPLLHAAACDRAKRLPLVRLLLEHGADVNTKDVSGRTALHIVMAWSDWAVWSNTETLLVSLLLDRGADVNARDNQMQTPLHLAAEAGGERIYQLLKGQGADEYATDSFGRSAESIKSSRACTLKLPERTNHQEKIDRLIREFLEETDTGDIISCVNYTEYYEEEDYDSDQIAFFSRLSNTLKDRVSLSLSLRKRLLKH